MARERFILRYRGQGAGPEDVIARLGELQDAVVVDSTPRMLLVESEPEPLRRLVDGLPDWVMGVEQRYAVPDTRKKVERAPG
jgi:hypothetical protein